MHFAIKTLSTECTNHAILLYRSLFLSLSPTLFLSILISIYHNIIQFILFGLIIHTQASKLYNEFRCILKLQIVFTLLISRERHIIRSKETVSDEDEIGETQAPRNGKHTTESDFKMIFSLSLVYKSIAET